MIAAIEFESPPGYELLEQVGRGGMGVVFRARDLALDRDIAVKFLLARYAPNSPQAVRFLSEARVTAYLQHPGIPAVHQVGQLADGRPWLAMKLIRGQNLAALWANRGRTPADVSDWLPVFTGICQAVGAAHQAGFIHRDLKPLNVMVGAFGEVQVMDWGLAKRLESRNAIESVATGETAPSSIDSTAGPDLGETAASEDDPDRTSGLDAAEPGGTRAGTILGTPQYMAPEQARGEVDRLDARTDVFALGCILCEALTGAPPLAPDSSISGYAANRYADAFDRIDRCGADAELIELCKRCLAFDPAERPENGAAVAEAVVQYQANFSERTKQAELVLQRREVQAQEERKRRRALTWWAGAAAAILLTGAVGTTIGFLRARDWAAAERTANAEAQRKRTEADEARGAAEREQQNAIKRLKQIEKGVESFAGMIINLDPTQERSGGDPVYVQLRRKAEKLATELDGEAVGDPLAVARLQSLLGRAITQLGNSEAATPILEKAHATRLRELGAEHDDTVETARELAQTHYLNGKQTQALELFQHVLAVRTAKLGPDNKLTLVAIISLANVRSSQGKKAEALEMYRKARAGWLKLNGGAEDDSSLVLLGNIASLLDREDSRDEAIGLYEEALAGRIKISGSDSTTTAQIRRSLGRAYWHAGRFREAVETLELARSELDRVFGSDSDDSLDVLFWLGRAYWDNGQLPVSIQIFEQLRATLTKKFGPDSSELLVNLDYLAYAYRLSGQWNEVQTYSERIMKTLLERSIEKNDTEPARNPTYAYLTDSRLKLFSRSVERLVDAGKLELASKWQRRWVDHIRTQYRNPTTLLLAARDGMLAHASRATTSEKRSAGDVTATVFQLYDEWGNREKAAAWRLELEKAAASRMNEPDRKAATWVLSNRGVIRTNGGQSVIDQLTSLPSEPFRLTMVAVGGKTTSDADLERFKACSEIAEFNLDGSPVTDAGLAHLSDLNRLSVFSARDTKLTGSGFERLSRATGLQWLTLINAPFTDEGMKHVAGFRKLAHLNLYATKVTDAGLVHLHGLHDLTDLTLGATIVSDAGLKNLKGHKGLRKLWLHNNPITDAGLEHLKELPALADLTLLAIPITDKGLIALRDVKSLTRLNIGWTQVTDAGLVNLPDGLTHLNIDRTVVTDDGLPRLHKLKGLKELFLTRTKVSEKGVTALHAALPACRIVYSDGSGKDVTLEAKAATSPKAR